MLHKVIRVAHAVSYIPVKRHGWRVLRRGQRILNRKKAEVRYEALSARAEALPWRPVTLPNFAETRLAQEEQCASNWNFSEDGSIAVTIHSVTASVLPRRPYSNLSTDLPYLWQMSLGYLGYMLPACDGDDASARRAFIELAVGFSDFESWSAPSAQDRHWHPYSVSHRLINMIAGRQFLSRHMPDDELDPLDQAIRLCTQLILESTEYDIHYNHLTKNLMALIVSEAFRIGKVSAALFSEYRAAAEYQVLDDGGHAELCPMYHAQFLADLLVISALPSKTMAPGMADWLAKTTNRMQSALRSMSLTNGDIAMFGDSWRGEAPTSAFLAPGNFTPPGVAERETLSNTGYTKLWGGAFCAIIDHGHIGADDNPGHAHDDALSVQVAINGMPAILDYGVESYTPGPGRIRSRGRAWHNAPTFNGDRGMDSWGAFRVGRRTKPPVWICGTCDEWVWLSGKRFSLDHEGPTSERLILLHAQLGVVIRDRWLGPIGTSNFHLAPDARKYVTVTAGATAKEEHTQIFSIFGHAEPAESLEVIPDDREALIVISTYDNNPTTVGKRALTAFSQGSEIF